MRSNSCSTRNIIPTPLTFISGSLPNNMASALASPNPTRRKLLHGCRRMYGVAEVHGCRGSVVFSGSAAQVESAFHTQIHTYKIGMKFITPTRAIPKSPRPSPE